MYHLDRPQDRIAHDLHGKDNGSTPVIRVPECGHGPQAQFPAPDVPALERLIGEVHLHA